MITPEQFAEIQAKRQSLMEREVTLEAELEDAVFGNNWQVASQLQNRLNLTFRTRRRLEESVWLDDTTA